MKKGIYLGACKAYHPNHNIVYQDINGKRDLNGDMLDIDLTPYDFIIATPPCNWWSRANPYNYKSKYALTTRHLLPLMLIKLGKQNKPFILECVKNDKRYTENKIFRICDELKIYHQNVGRHTYFTNIKDIDLQCPQIQDFRYGGIRVNNDGYNQGGTNVARVINIFLFYVEVELEKAISFTTVA